MALAKDSSAVDVRLADLPKDRAGLAIGRCLSVKGFCVLAPSLEDGRLAAALADARDLSTEGKLGQPPTMIVEGLLGLQGSARICDLGLPDGEDPDRLGGQSLADLDSQLTEYGMLAFPYMSSIGAELKTRTAGVLHEAGLPPDEGPQLSGDACSKWMTIFAHHRMMCVWCLGPEKGSLELQPFDDVSNGAIVSMPPGTLVILRPDALQHRFTSAGKSFCLTCFFQKDQRPSKYLAPDKDLTPCCQALEEWAHDLIKEYKESFPEEQAKFKLPRSWEQMANHTSFVGQHIAVRTASIRQVGSWDPVDWTCAFLTGPDYAGEVPLTRWDHNMLYDPDHIHDAGLDGTWAWKSTCRHGAFMEGIELFDNMQFRLSKVEAGGMDPGHRLILETGYCALVRDGFKSSKLMNSRGGMYVANPPSTEWNDAPKTSGGGGVCGGGGSIACGRFSFTHGMKGPCISVDVEGASSLVIVGMACTNLSRVGNWEPIPYGVCSSYSLMLAPTTFAWASARKHFSSAGRTFSFDASADGHIKGECCVSMVLKALTDVVDNDVVVKDDENFIGALAASATNQSGRRANMTAPDAAAFQEVIADCVRQADISPLDIDGCDCYADGGILGDAVEASATAKAYRPDGMLNVEETAPLALFASKGPIGNQIEACGLSSILKILLGAQFGLMYPNVHLRILNPHVDLEICERPAMLSGEPMEFAMESCYVGLTCRSFAGTNCHAICWGQITEDRVSVLPEPEWKRDKILFWPEGGGDLEDDQMPMKGYSIVGTWNGWEPQQMVKESPGVWSCTIALGINCWERFQILLDESKDRVLYPEYAGAGRGVGVFGPAAKERSESWLIDGRSSDSETAARDESALVPYVPPNREDSGLPGDQYNIQLSVKGKYRNVDWVRVADAERQPVDVGTYSVAGTWSEWELQAMQPDASVPGLFSLEVRLEHGPGYFQIVRNGDWGQTLYPDHHGSTDPSTGAILGPDDTVGAAWMLYGRRGDVYRIDFQRSCSPDGVDSRRLSWSLVRSAGR